MTKTLDVITDVVRNTKHPFRQVDDRPDKPKKHRYERRAYPSGVCKERATTSEPKSPVARRVASIFGSGFVAPRSQPHFGGCSLVAPRQNRKSTQQTWSYL